LLALHALLHQIHDIIGQLLLRGEKKPNSVVGMGNGEKLPAFWAIPYLKD